MSYAATVSLLDGKQTLLSVDAILKLSNTLRRTKSRFKRSAQIWRRTRRFSSSFRASSLECVTPMWHRKWLIDDGCAQMHTPRGPRDPLGDLWVALMPWNSKSMCTQMIVIHWLIFKSVRRSNESNSTCIGTNLPFMRVYLFIQRRVKDAHCMWEQHKIGCATKKGKKRKPGNNVRLKRQRWSRIFRSHPSE